MAKSRKKSIKRKSFGKKKGSEKSRRGFRQKGDKKFPARLKLSLLIILVSIFVFSLVKFGKWAGFELVSQLQNDVKVEQEEHLAKIKDYAKQLKEESDFLKDNLFNSPEEISAEWQDLSNENGDQPDDGEIQARLNQSTKIANQIRREFIYYNSDLSIQNFGLKSEEVEKEIYLAWIVPELVDRLVRSVEYSLYLPDDSNDDRLPELAGRNLEALQAELDKILVNANEE